MKKTAYLFLTLMLMAQVQAATIFSNNKLYGLKDDNGNIVLKAQYQQIEQLEYTPVKTILVPMQSTKENKPVKSNKYKIQQNGLFGVSDDEGNIICETKYDDIKMNAYGEIITVKGDKETLLNPVKNKVKKTTKTVESIVGLPVTIVASVLMPVEVISKIGKK